MVRFRSILIACTIATAAVGGTGSFAVEVADGERGGAVRTESNQELTASDAGRLIRGELPSVDSVTAKYARPGTSLRCQQDWAAFRNAKVRVKPVRASIELLRANADRAGISRRKLHNALAVFLKNQSALPNQKYISIVDFDKHAGTKRLFTVNLETGKIDAFHVSSSYGSSPTANGWSTHFSNRNDESNANSLGCAVASGLHYSKTKRRNQMTLHGLEKTNDNMCQRTIWMHKANYVGQGAARSEGCLAIKPSDEQTILDRVGDGLICSYREGQIFQAAGHYRKHKGGHYKKASRYKHGKYKKHSRRARRHRARH